MSETPDYQSETTSVTEPAVVERVVVESKPNRLYQATAWVAIVAGILFIVGTVFFSGFLLGRHSDGPRHFGPGMTGPGMMMERGGQEGGPGMHRGGPAGPAWPGREDGDDGPAPQRPGGPAGPGQLPPTAAPGR